MNIADQLPKPLNLFTVDVPANQYYDFELAPDSTYPLKGVTYPVDYGNIPGHTGEDGHELDFYIGTTLNGLIGYVVVFRGDDRPNEHKFYVGLTEQDQQSILSELNPVLIEQQGIDNLDELLKAIEPFKDEA